MGRREPVLRDLDLNVPAGQRVLLVGPSGSGKSTLLRALAGLLLTVDSGDLSGRVALDDREPGERPGSVGLVLQEPGSGTVAATVGRDVAFGLENVGVPREEMPPRVTAALSAVGLGDLPLDTPTHTLSGGQTQRLALAGALALRPSLLLLDEPTAMLDEATAAEVRDAVRAGGAGLTTVLVEHRIGPWVDHVDRIVVLDRDGRIRHDGVPTEVLAEHGEQLAADGVWVPGVPAPESLPVELPDLDRAEVQPISADPLRVERTRHRLDGSSERRTVLTTEDPLAVAKGTATALVGPSGGGKSSWLATLAGLLTPVEGRVTGPDGAPVAGRPAEDVARLVGWVPQWSSSALLARTVLDEVMLAGRNLGTADEGGARHLLEVLGLAHLERADPQTLSGGEQRRLAVAAATAHGPSVVLADEPTVGQDRGTWAAVAGLLTAHRERGGGVVVATHDPDLVALTDDVREVHPPADVIPLGRCAPSGRDTAQSGPGGRIPSGADAPSGPEGHIPSGADAPSGPEGRIPSGADAPARPRAVLSACGPLSLFAAAGLPMIAAVLSPGWQVSAWILALSAVCAVIGLATIPGTGPGWTDVGRWRGLALRLLPALVGGLSVGWSTWLLGGQDLGTAASAALRMLNIVVPSAITLAFIDPDDLADHLGQRLHLPPRPVVALGAALQRIQSFGAAWTEVGWARRLRGYGLSWRRPRTVAAHLWQSTFGMLLRSLGSAATLAVAMDARGFAVAGRRTWAAPAPWRWPDTVIVLVSLLPLVVVALARV